MEWPWDMLNDMVSGLKGKRKVTSSQTKCQNILKAIEWPSSLLCYNDQDELLLFIFINLLFVAQSRRLTITAQTAQISAVPAVSKVSQNSDFILLKFVLCIIPIGLRFRKYKFFFCVFVCNLSQAVWFFRSFEKKLFSNFCCFSIIACNICFFLCNWTVTLILFAVMVVGILHFCVSTFLFVFIPFFFFIHIFLINNNSY